jgi:hypothetical protein
MNQAERKFAISIFLQGGHGPFRGLDAPFSAESQRKRSLRTMSNVARVPVIYRIMLINIDKKRAI